MEWTVTDQVQGMYSGSNHGFSVRDASENGPGVEQQFEAARPGQAHPSS
jgi:large repetitive protein